jgi:nicotinate-nucleotide adenylyltransferase
MTVASPPALGIFGGTFDPIHRGHMAMARRAVERFGLDRLLLVPAWQPPHKTGRTLAAWRHRFAMAGLACQDLDRVHVSAVEKIRSGMSFTVETLEHFRGRVGPDAPIVFLMGSDSLAELPAWKDHARLLELAHILVAPRPGVERNLALAALGPDLRRRAVTESEQEGPPAGPAGSILWLDWQPLDLSGSEIRRRLGAGEPIEDLVPPPVAAYILRHRIYPESRSPQSS